ncbi:MAG: hypothetical protein JJT89_17050 [Nitriliruptoraceae bacterium]|nr:hypothetical protein [Nitriliruptoraceae bacterium]
MTDDVAVPSSTSPPAGGEDAVAALRDELAHIATLPIAERPARFAAANATLGAALAELDEV